MELNETPSKVILVDMDDTICARIPRLLTYIAEEHGIHLATEEVQELSRPIADTGKGIGEFSSEARITRREWYFSGMEPIPGVKEAITWLREAGHTIHIATHRPPETHDLTREWLHRYDVPYNNIIEDVPQNKGLLPGDVLIDDFHRNVYNAIEAGMSGVLFRQPYSEPAECEGAVVGDSWPDILSQLGLGARR